MKLCDVCNHGLVVSHRWGISMCYDCLRWYNRLFTDKADVLMLSIPYKIEMIRTAIAAEEIGRHL